ncbi:MAG: 50S ribosomal protein L31e [Candidatus Thermoplasmatota archaeon]|jgi:large subunit ribosomal protein L31e|nr:50S ribosomal protein L31e [Candidatus Thermoplasmatota archaeon]
MAEEIERIYVIPLKKNNYRSSVAAPYAVKKVKSFLTRHMKVENDKVWIDDSLNNALWSRGKFHIPTKIRVKAVKFDDGVVEAYLPELEFKKSRREILKEEKAKKEPILKKEKPEEEKPAEGEEKIEIAPTVGGDVKIKKKKVREKKEKPVKEEKPVVKEKTVEEKTVEEKPEEKKVEPKSKKKSSSKPKAKAAKTTKKGKGAKKKSE